MYKVGVERDFEAIHALVGDVPEEEKHPHPHKYRIEWVFHITSLDQRGFSLDIALLERLLENQCGEIKGVNLNSLEYFKERNSSLENLCSFFTTTLRDKLIGELSGEDARRITSMEIKIWENDHAWAGEVTEFPKP